MRCALVWSKIKQQKKLSVLPCNEWQLNSAKQPDLPLQRYEAFNVTTNSHINVMLYACRCLLMPHTASVFFFTTHIQVVANKFYLAKQSTERSGPLPSCHRCTTISLVASVTRLVSATCAIQLISNHLFCRMTWDGWISPSTSPDG